MKKIPLIISEDYSEELWPNLTSGSGRYCFLAELIYGNSVNHNMKNTSLNMTTSQ